MDQGGVSHRASLFRLDGKSALIVGGYGGIGQVVSQLFSEYGAAVMVAGRSIDKASALAAQLSRDGRRVVGASVDVSDRGSVEALVAECVKQLGGVDILVDLASVEHQARAEDFSEADWQQIIDINLTGAFLLSQAAGRAMIAGKRGGRIVHFSSTRSVAGGRRGFSAYAASKAGVNQLVRQLATEWAPHGITVNAVAPGFVPTELVKGALQDQKFTAMMLNRIPLGRFGEPIEMAGGVLFFASPAASFVTGQILFVDGGVTASS